MRRALALWLTVCVLGSAEVFAQDGSPETSVISTAPTLRSFVADSIVRNAVERESSTRRLALSLGRAERLQAQQPAAQDRSWIRRHPVLFGTAVGFASGYLAVRLTSPPEEDTGNEFSPEFYALVVGGMGAGVGALIGFLVGR